MKVIIMYKEELEKAYIDNELTQQECADLFGVSKRTIASYMKKYNIVGRKERNDKWAFRISEKLKGNKNGLGVVCSEEKKLKIKNALKNKYANNPEQTPMFGRHHSSETKELMREKMLGRKHSEDTKQKMSIAKKTDKHREIAIRNLANHFSSSKYEYNSLEKIGYEKLAYADVSFLPQYRIGDFIVDAYIPKFNIVVEFLGKYWHTKKENIKRDERKRKYFADNGYKLVEVWEDDINDWNPKEM